MLLFHWCGNDTTMGNSACSLLQIAKLVKIVKEVASLTGPVMNRDNDREGVSAVKPTSNESIHYRFPSSHLDRRAH